MARIEGEPTEENHLKRKEWRELEWMMRKKKKGKKSLIDI